MVTNNQHLPSKNKQKCYPFYGSFLSSWVILSHDFMKITNVLILTLKKNSRTGLVIQSLRKHLFQWRIFLHLAVDEENNIYNLFQWTCKLRQNV